MFIARDKELKLLSDNLNDISTVTIIYGKRRVGKTTLIKEALKKSNKINIYYECVKASLEHNLGLFTNTLVEYDVIGEGISFKNFDSLFAYLNSQNNEYNIIFDEYPYLKFSEKSQYVDSIFQRIIDNRISNINIVLSGSHIGMMLDLTKHDNSLYGRFTSQIALQDLDYVDASLFYKNKSIYEKVAFYSVFGGSPFVLGKLNNDLSLKENIIKLLLDKESIIYSYVSSLLTSDISFYEQAKKIFSFIGNSRIKYNDLQSKLNMEPNGLLSKQLKTLIDMKFIRKNYPINKLTDDKKATYELNDNLLRFYYTYLYKNNSILEILDKEIFYDKYIEKSLNTFISFRFEDIVKMYFKLKKDPKISNIGTYYYDDPKNKQNGEFDVVLEQDNGFVICEVKYFKEKLTKAIIYNEVEKIKEITELKVTGICFVSCNGFDEENKSYITGAEIYNVKEK